MYFPSFSLPIVFFHSLDVSWQFASVIALRLSCGFLHPEDFAKNSLDVPDGTGSSVKRCQPVTASLWTPTWPAALGFRIGRRTLLPGSHHCWPLLLNGIQGKCHRCRSYHLLLNWIRGKFWQKIQSHGEPQGHSCKSLHLYPNTQLYSHIYTDVQKQLYRYLVVSCFRNASRCSGDIKSLCTSFVSSRRRRWKGLKSSLGKEGEKKELLN